MCERHIIELAEMRAALCPVDPPRDHLVALRMISAMKSKLEYFETHARPDDIISGVHPLETPLLTKIQG